MPHTPGPWATVDAEWMISQRSGMGYRYFPVRSSGQTWDIANVFADEDDPEMLANARLIAAAPELLQELKRLLSMWEKAIGWEKDYMDMGDAARAAIAKAEGGE